ncbi:hypothetical protein BD408DRAFT_479805 [Parasitella parasitica]|nr:hypothetical protein BD408DRAFT_479805 [Parasitella parasitica]
MGRFEHILASLKVYFTVKMQEGMSAKSSVAVDKVYIGTDKLLPTERFLFKSKVVGKVGKGTGQQGHSGVAPGGRGFLHSLRCSIYKNFLSILKEYTSAPISPHLCCISVFGAAV